MDFIAIDIETANEKRDSICSIALLKYKDNRICDALYTHIDPETYFSSINTSIHGITKEDVADSPKMYQMYDAIIRFIDNHIIVAHNTSFDMYALCDSFRRYNLPLPNNLYFCTYRLSKDLYNLPSYRLQDLAIHFDIENEEYHNAFYDAKVCAQIAYCILKDQGISLNELVEKQNFKYGILGENGFVKKSTNKKIINLTYNQELNDKNHIFYGKHICFTGALKSFTRKEVAQTITDIGSIYDSTVKKSTNYLVVGDLENLEKTHNYTKSTKIIKAERLSNEGQNIEVLSEMDFLKLLSTFTPTLTKA
ncbi:MULTISPECIES: exonuclease domain-containing protein [Staphylococcus]|uniref:exonuclease domain-containing protein n=1 Tax=Staphylococcus TaxID=1279 RepID=UPI000763BAA3|nr:MULTISPECIES: exonuclease domain-containing protein [Staphylococcus]KXA44537.1 putative DNA polymerase III, epsilon subunit [Staphylococcus simulans]MDK8175346.1 exonuclease domain-containing protein [Staphylococcus simulans]OFM14815.1 exonuclease [Staphylococcus sp. HMSC059E03]OFO48084.1 exonuclease [Staphylococcus sp. HMSC072B07]OFV06360.1 exonuclease [Staphylococcus sp. HMSC12H08]